MEKFTKLDDAKNVVTYEQFGAVGDGGDGEQTIHHTDVLHELYALVGIVLIVLRLTLGKKDLKIRMIPFQILAVFIVLLEVGKQAVSLKLGYNPYHLPFHFCSLFLCCFFISLAAGRHFC